MRRKYLAVVTLLLIVGIWTWWHRQEAAPQSPLPTNKPEQSGTMVSEQTKNTPPITNGAASFSPAKSSISAMAQKREKQMEEARETGLNEWRTPIEFYGKVIDENNSPVVGATVDLSCNDLSLKGTSFYHKTSDANGLFSITGITGKLLTVKVMKENYYTSKKDNGSFYYAGQNVNFTPDARNPIIFHLQNKGHGEPLSENDFPVGMGQIVQLHHDGTPVEIDLFNGKQVSAGSGQLKLEYWRDVSNKNANKFDWKLQLSAPGGGLIETDEEFVFKAPANGYQPSIVLDMPATNQNWIGEVRTKFYMQLPNGNFGRINFYLLPRNGVFTIHSAINPTGSQNLESQ